MILFVRLPCGHMKLSPAADHSVVACGHPGCGRTWTLVRGGGGVLTAREVEAT